VQADYTKQLDEIVRILSKPTAPAWVTPLVSMIFGIAGALIGLWLNDFYKRFKLRRVLYRNLVSLFQGLDRIQTFSNPAEIKNEMKFDAQAFLKANQELYVSLAEHETAEFLYDAFRSVADDSITDWSKLHGVEGTFLLAVKFGWLKKGWLWFVCSRFEYKMLKKRLEERDQELQQKIAAKPQDPEPKGPQP
jgi:hypothetical protein